MSAGWGTSFFTASTPPAAPLEIAASPWALPDYVSTEWGFDGLLHVTVKSENGYAACRSFTKNIFGSDQDWTRMIFWEIENMKKDCDQAA